VGSLLSSRAPDRFIRPVITFVIFASGLKYIGVPVAALGWVLCAALAAVAGAWLARWWRRREPPPLAGDAVVSLNRDSQPDVLELRRKAR
jgi:uncharacterized membrane protein YfcA